MTPKSPFLVIDFISPLLCEELIDYCDFTVPDCNIEGKEILTFKTCEQAEAIVYERLMQLMPMIQEYYDFDYKGTEPVMFDWYPEGSQGQLASENSTYLRGKWLRTKQRDITGILFLSDYREDVPFDLDYEVYGGKLEFPQHQFGFNPRRGTLILFPSDPHFINTTSEIVAGDLFQAKIQIAAKTPYIYNPEKFPGDYTKWFASEL